VTLRLHRVLWPRLQQVPQLLRVYQEIEQPLVPVLQRMERYGVLIDRAMLRAQSGEIALRLREIEALAHVEAAGPFNLESPKQLQQILFERLGLPVMRKTPSGTPSTAEDVLEELAVDYPLPRLILEYRGLAKLRSTYTERLPEQINPDTGRVHTSYHQAVAATGRLSSTDPNLQNIPIRSPEAAGSARLSSPRAARSCWPPTTRRSNFASWRTCRAMKACCARLPRSVISTRPPPPRCSVSHWTRCRRTSADRPRRSNFGLIYGMSAFGLARQLGVARAAAQATWSCILRATRECGATWMRRASRRGAMATSRRYSAGGCTCPRSLTQPAAAAGRRARRDQRADAGTAADIIKRAMITIDTWCQRPDVPASC